MITDIFFNLASDITGIIFSVFPACTSLPEGLSGTIQSIFTGAWSWNTIFPISEMVTVAFIILPIEAVILGASLISRISSTIFGRTIGFH